MTWFFPFRMHFRSLAATVFALSCLVPATGHGAFQPSEKPIPLSGVNTSIRTVWFSPDGAKVHGDFDHLVAWNLETRNVLSTTPIPGRKVHASLVTSDGTFWMQGSLGYDDPAKRDVNHTHPALVSGSLDGALESRKTGSTVFGRGVFIPGSRKAVFVVSEKRRYSVRAYDATAAKLSTTYVRPAKPRKRVPTHLAVSSDGKRLAVGLGGKGSGAAVYDVETGARLHLHKTRAEVTSVSFVGEDLLFSDLEGHIYGWKLGGKRAGRALLLLKCPFRIMHMAVDPSGESAVVGALRGVHWVDLKQKKVRRQLLKSRAMDIRFSADGTKVAIGVQKTLQLPKIPSVYVFVQSSR
jgi:WD40 repeat protein